MFSISFYLLFHFFFSENGTPSLYLSVYLSICLLVSIWMVTLIVLCMTILNGTEMDEFETTVYWSFKKFSELIISDSFRSAV